MNCMQYCLYTPYFVCFSSYLLSLGADPQLENDCAEKPADLIEPDNKELLELFGLLAVNDWDLPSQEARNVIPPPSLSQLTARAGRGKGPGPPASSFSGRLQDCGSGAEAGLTESPSASLKWTAYRGQRFPLKPADLFLFSGIKVLKVLVGLKDVVEHHRCCSVRSL